jgi:hypothetical protein
MVKKSHHTNETTAFQPEENDGSRTEPEMRVDVKASPVKCWKTVAHLREENADTLIESAEENSATWNSEIGGDSTPVFKGGKQFAQRRHATFKQPKLCEK